MRKNFLWITVGIVLMNGIGMTVVFPLLPFLLGSYLPASQIVIGMSALASVFAACTFLAAPILGALSDRYGRKKILIISLLGSVVGYILFGIGGALWVLFLGRIIDGLTAGNISTLFAYIADSTAPHERTKWFGYIGAAMGIRMHDWACTGRSAGRHFNYAAVFRYCRYNVTLRYLHIFISAGITDSRKTINPFFNKEFQYLRAIQRHFHHARGQSAYHHWRILLCWIRNLSFQFQHLLKRYFRVGACAYRWYIYSYRSLRYSFASCVIAASSQKVQ